MEERIFFSRLKQWVTSQTRPLMHINDLPIPIPIHQRGVKTTQQTTVAAASCILRSKLLNLDDSCLMDLNDYFAKFCSDDMYIEPNPVTISSEAEIPVINSERQVWNLLSALKRTATGPDQIPYWVWKEHAEIFTPLITKIWNLSISTQCLPSSWKRKMYNFNCLCKL